MVHGVSTILLPDSLVEWQKYLPGHDLADADSRHAGEQLGREARAGEQLGREARAGEQLGREARATEQPGRKNGSAGERGDKSDRGSKLAHAGNGSAGHQNTGRSDVAPADAATGSGAAAPRSFSRFVVGPENRLAASIVHDLLQPHARRYSPLSIYGPSGGGKSLLARGLALLWQKHHPECRVVVTSGAEFARDFAAAVERQDLPAWRRALHAAGFLLVEDLGQLAGKGPAQQELSHALDELQARDALVVTTARSLPQQIVALTAGLRSRLSAGLTVHLALPGPAARRVILEQLAEQRGLTLPKQALHSLAAGPNVPITALQGAIRQLELASRSGAIDHDALRRLAAEAPQSEGPTLKQIAGAVAKHFGLRLADLRSPSRRAVAVAARGVTIYLARLLTSNSLDQIGSYLGGRDHTTVLHSQRRTEKLVKRDPVTRHAVAELRKTLGV